MTTAAPELSTDDGNADISSHNDREAVTTSETGTKQVQNKYPLNLCTDLTLEDALKLDERLPRGDWRLADWKKAAASVGETTDKGLSIITWVDDPNHLEKGQWEVICDNIWDVDTANFLVVAPQILQGWQCEAEARKRAEEALEVAKKDIFLIAAHSEDANILLAKINAILAEKEGV
jgi:hypothetical protein